MSSNESSLASQHPDGWRTPRNDIVQPHQQPLQPDNIGPVVFTRHLWQRTMSDADETERGEPNKSQSTNTEANHNNASAPSRRTSSTISLRSRQRSPTLSHHSKAPSTPDDSPPFKTTRKRSAGIVEQEDREIDSNETSPAHTRTSSDESTMHVCICQPDPKIPRPRNGK